MKYIWLVILMKLMLSPENHTTVYDNTMPEMPSISVGVVIPLYINDDSPLAVENPPFFSNTAFSFDHGLFQEYKEVIEELTVESHATAMSAEMALNLLTEQEIDSGDTMFDQWDAGSRASLGKQRFEVTEQTLQKLKEAGVPEPVLYQLTLMQGQQFDNQEIFWTTVEKYVDEATLTEYQSVIVTHAAANVSRSSFYDASNSNTSFSAYYSQKSQQNKAAWDLLLYYPRVAKKALSSGGKGPPRKTSYSLEEEKGVFRILALLKRWGVPKPSTLLLIALGLYLLLALLSRRH